MKTHVDVKIEGSSYEISLTRLIDQQVKEITGYLSKEFDEPVFKLCYIKFEDGTELRCEGEHDFPYLVTCGEKSAPEYNDEVLESVWKSDPDNEDEEV